MQRNITITTLIGTAAVIAALTGCSSSSNSSGPHVYSQIDRLGRPAVNEVFATVANNRHQVNDTDNPTDDAGQLAGDIQTFMTTTAGRSQAITNVAKAVLVPDVLVANLNGTAPGYLGVETGNAGATFGGRALSDDVVDTSLGVIFGNTIPALGLAPDDGHEIPGLTTDNVGPGAKHFQVLFPYVGPPQ